MRFIISWLVVGNLPSNTIFIWVCFIEVVVPDTRFKFYIIKWHHYFFVTFPPIFSAFIVFVKSEIRNKIKMAHFAFAFLPSYTIQMIFFLCLICSLSARIKSQKIIVLSQARSEKKKIVKKIQTISNSSKTTGSISLAHFHVINTVSFILYILSFTIYQVIQS